MSMRRRLVLSVIMVFALINSSVLASEPYPESKCNKINATALAIGMGALGVAVGVTVGIVVGGLLVQRNDMAFIYGGMAVCGVLGARWGYRYFCPGPGTLKREKSAYLLNATPLFLEATNR